MPRVRFMPGIVLQARSTDVSPVKQLLGEGVMRAGVVDRSPRGSAHTYDPALMSTALSFSNVIVSGLPSFA